MVTVFLFVCIGAVSAAVTHDSSRWLIVTRGFNSHPFTRLPSISRRFLTGPVRFWQGAHLLLLLLRTLWPVVPIIPLILSVVSAVTVLSVVSVTSSISSITSVIIVVSSVISITTVSLPSISPFIIITSSASTVASVISVSSIPSLPVIMAIPVFSLIPRWWSSSTPWRSGPCSPPSSTPLGRTIISWASVISPPWRNIRFLPLLPMS